MVEQLFLGRVLCTGISGSFVLGLPIFQYYYLAFDMGNETVTFVDLKLSNETELELSNETEAYIEGPEKELEEKEKELDGTASTSTGYHLYQAFTTGIVVLAASCIYLWK